MREVIKKSLNSIQEFWELSDDEMGQIVPSNNEELAILVIRVFNALDYFFGGDYDLQIDWLRSNNVHLEPSPLAVMTKGRGLSRVVKYLEKLIKL